MNDIVRTQTMATDGPAIPRPGTGRTPPQAPIEDPGTVFVLFLAALAAAGR
jgi:hypothetical protein